MKKRILMAVLCAWGVQMARVYPAQAAGNPALVPVARETQVYKQTGQGWMARHETVKSEARKGQAQLIFIGDSITHWWEIKGTEPWNKTYAPLNAINMGFGGDKVQHVLWRLQNGEIDGISPKVAVIMIGTNNSKTDTPENTAEGIKEICAVLRAKLPQTKILLLAIFPRNTPDDPRHLTNLKVNAIISRQADGKRIHYLDISKAFTDHDGVVPKTLMEDLLHPNAAGYQVWADAMNPKLMELLSGKQ